MYFLLSIILVLFVWLLTRKALYRYFSFSISDKVKKFIPFFYFFFGVLCSLFYLKYDAIGYEYGLGCTFCNKNMPYGLTPQRNPDYPQNLVLLDEDYLELVGSGFRYRQSSFEIKDFLGYGYNDISVIVKCTDSLNTIKYLISYETKYKSKKGNPEISFKDLSNSDFEQVKDKYKWFDVDKEKGYTVERNKFLSMFGALLSLFFIVRNLFRLLRINKATQ